MARFYAEIQGNRGPASRQGSAQSGVWGHLRGWNVGARVEVRTAPRDDGRDLVSVTATKGSYGGDSGPEVARFYEDGTIELRHPQTGSVLFSGGIPSREYGPRE